MKLFVLLLCGLQILFSQQAWTQKKGEAYIQIGASIFSYDQIYDKNSNSAKLGRSISEIVLSSYSEYGLTDDIMLSLTLPFHIISNGEVDNKIILNATKKGDLSEFGNIETALSYKLYSEGSLVASANMALQLNTSTRDNLTGLQTGFNATTIKTKLLAGIGTEDYFASWGIGLALSNNDYLNRYLISGQLGKEFLADRSLLFILGFSYSITDGEKTDAENIAINENATNTGLYLNQQAYSAWSAKVGYKFNKDYFFWLSMAGGVGKNIGKALVYNVAFAYQLTN